MGLEVTGLLVKSNGCGDVGYKQSTGRCDGAVEKPPVPGPQQCRLDKLHVAYQRTT